MSMQTQLDTIRDEARSLQANADYCGALAGAVKDALDEVRKTADATSPLGRLLSDPVVSASQTLLSLLQDIAGRSNVAAEAIEAAEDGLRRSLLTPAEVSELRARAA
ncbi:MAG: hypothetical protein ABWX67_17275 [Allosphingosinicella sp.]